jgi:hypothetical protein
VEGYAVEFSGGRGGAEGHTAATGGWQLFHSPALQQAVEAALADLQRYQHAAAYLTLTGNVVSEALTVASTRLQLSGPGACQSDGRNRPRA